MDDAARRSLGNLASAHPLARLKAVHGLGELVRVEVEAWIRAAEGEQVGAARRAGASWEEIARHAGIKTGQAAGRRFREWR